MTDPGRARSSILEIVLVRCTEATYRRAQASLHELLSEPGHHGALLRSAAAPHDLALHLRTEAACSNAIGASTLGLRIAAALRDFGPVSHSVWIDITTSTATEDL